MGQISQRSHTPKPYHRSGTKEPSSPLPAPLRDRLESELGDLLFACAQLGRWLGINSEEALKGCCDRFIQRFTEMERVATTPLSEQSEEELEAGWQGAKKRLKER